MEIKKKKIGFVIGQLSSGGAERVISTLSNELINKFDITIITFTKSEPFYRLDERIKVIACSENISKSSSVFDALRLNFKLVKQISKIAKNEKVGLLIGFITSANILTVIASKLNGIPSIISERNNPLVEKVPKFWTVLRSLVYPKTDILVLQTDGVKKLYDKKIDSKKTIILPNPISSDLSKLRSINDNIKTEKIILTVGRLDKAKCHDKLIDVFKEINHKDWKLKIIGNGGEKERLLKQINDLGLSKNIEILSKVKNIHEYYNKASIFVFTSKTEGFPNALLEAMHFGLPSISTDCNFGPSDLINDGINGYLIPVNDKEALTNKLLTLMDNENLQKQFSENAKRTTEKYMSKNVIEQWEKLINIYI